MSHQPAATTSDADAPSLEGEIERRVKAKSKKHFLIIILLAYMAASPWIMFRDIGQSSPRNGFQALVLPSLPFFCGLIYVLAKRKKWLSDYREKLPGIIQAEQAGKAQVAIQQQLAQEVQHIAPWKASYLYGHPAMSNPIRNVRVGFRDSEVVIYDGATCVEQAVLPLQDLRRVDFVVQPKGGAGKADVLMGGMIAGHRGGNLAVAAGAMNILADLVTRDKNIITCLMVRPDGFEYQVVFESEHGQFLVTRINKAKFDLPSPAQLAPATP